VPLRRRGAIHDGVAVVVGADSTILSGMPRVAPFRGLQYAIDRFAAPEVSERIRLPEDADAPPALLADLTDVACPPYDVISDAQRAELLRRHERNAVRLEYSAEPGPHRAAAQTLAAWLDDGTIARRAEPNAWYYRHATAADPDDLAVEGVVVRVLLEPWGDGVRRHEHTMPGPKADRLSLLRATRTQLSPILSIYFDRSERYPHVMSRAWSEEWRARDGDGLLHQACAIEADERLLNYLGRQTLFIADGHHRYETALAYQAEVRAEPRFASAPHGDLAADWIMMMLVNAELTEMEIRPTHRLVLDGRTDGLRTLLAGDDPSFAAKPMAAEDLAGALEERRHDDAPAFGVVLPDAAALLVGDRAALGERLRDEPMSAPVRALDLTALHVTVLRDRLGIGPEEVAAGERLAYTRSASDAIGRVVGGEAAAAILVRATPLEQLAEVASAGDVMPQKSTYFYPKLLTGMVFNPLED
jgi:uncharacterized protein (DUF1015 family)